MLQLHKRQHPDYKYQPRRRRGQGADSPSIGGKGVFHFRLKFLTSSNKFYFSFPEEPLTPPHTPSEEDRLRLRGGLTLLEPPASLQESGANPEFLGVASGVPPIRWTVPSTWVLFARQAPSFILTRSSFQVHWTLPPPPGRGKPPPRLHGPVPKPVALPSTCRPLVLESLLLSHPCISLYSPPVHPFSPFLPGNPTSPVTL